MLAGAYCMGGSFLIPIWQAYTWLRYGAWPLLPLGAVWQWLGLPYPQIEWVGVQKILVGLLGDATSVVVFCVGAGLAAFGAYLCRPVN
jgi:hypothetical protein